MKETVNNVFTYHKQPFIVYNGRNGLIFDYSDKKNYFCSRKRKNGIDRITTYV